MLGECFRPNVQAAQSTIFSNFTLFAILVPGILSVLRVFALHKFYHAPFEVVHHFEYNTVPSILTDLGYSPIPLPAKYVQYGNEVPTPLWDLTPLQHLDEPYTLCYGTEWHRYPGSHLIPEGIDVRWIKTNFSGMMPRRWEASGPSKGKWPREETKTVRAGRFNDENKPSSETGTFVSASMHARSTANIRSTRLNATTSLRFICRLTRQHPPNPTGRPSQSGSENSAHHSWTLQVANGGAD